MYNVMENCIKTIQTFNNPVEKRGIDKSKPVLTIKVGAITKWVRDVLAIILMWKIISIIY